MNYTIYMVSLCLKDEPDSMQDFLVKALSKNDAEQKLINPFPTPIAGIR